MFITSENGGGNVEYASDPAIGNKGKEYMGVFTSVIITSQNGVYGDKGYFSRKNYKTGERFYFLEKGS